ncbi:MAG: hypothetical protein RIS55_406 [Actinomycetota bacterium]|jgi:hypothetical protein
MRRAKIALVSLALITLLSGCGGTSVADPTASTSAQPTIDPALIPDAAPADATLVDATQFDMGFGEYTFRAGNGSVWCTINFESNYAVCEQNEANALYTPLNVPDTCELTYGYQVRLWATAPSGLPVVDMPCSGGTYADPKGALTLNSGEKISSNGITCWVDGTNARCDNERGNYIALGPEIWALK